MRWPLHCKSGQQKGSSLIQGHRQRVILRHHADERQTCLVHGIINGGVHTVQQLLPHPVHHQMEPAGAELPQLHHGMLRIPQEEASCVVTTTQRSAPQTGQLGIPVPALPVRPADRSQTAAGSLQHPPSGVLLCHSRPPHSHRRRQQIEIGNTGVRHHSRFQRAAVQRHIGKIHQRPVGKTQRQIQIPQTDVAVQTQHPPAG